MIFIIDLVAERSVLRESLKGIIWTIFFNRLFGPVTPVTNEFMNVTYPLASNLPDLDSLIDEKINKFIHSLTESSNRGKIEVQFLSKGSNKKKTGWFSNSTYIDKEELKVWEVWRIDIEVLPLDQTNRNTQKSIRNFESNMGKVYDIIDKYKEHIPPITTLDSAPFPYKILIPDSNHTTDQATQTHEGEEGWGTYIKKILD
ncbi:hypothetical protein Cantr_09849 [Candida viswanathii]|uniref:Autophagy-related protein 101 n=1 Tax=Candida viswanathii TaxID=5486 RepID=A0A367YC20_9ASCO|nr:hypothetical protein Cantr_09849 [Candida viswanathii]